MWTASRNLYPDGVFWPKVNSRWTSFWSKLFLTVLATSVEWHFDDFWAKSHTQELQTNKVHKRIERPTIGEEKQFHTRVLKPWSYPSKRTGWQQGQTRATTSESAILGSNRFHCSVIFPLQQCLSMVSMWSPLIPNIRSRFAENNIPFQIFSLSFHSPHSLPLFLLPTDGDEWPPDICIGSLRCPGDHWIITGGPLPDCYCCFHTSHTSSLSASQIPPPAPTSSTSSCTSLTTISPHQTFPLPWIPEALCVPPSTPFTRLGGKQGLGLAPRQVVVHTGWVWRPDW